MINIIYNKEKLFSFSNQIKYKVKSTTMFGAVSIFVCKQEEIIRKIKQIHFV